MAPASSLVPASSLSTPPLPLTVAKSGKWTAMHHTATSYAGATMLKNSVYYAPIYFPTSATIDRLACIVGTAVATATGRMAIFNMTDGTFAGQVGSKLVDGGADNSLNVGPNIVVTWTISQAVSRGWYFLAMGLSTANPTLIKGNGGIGGAILNSIGGGDPTDWQNNAPVAGYSAGGYTTGALPSNPDTAGIVVASAVPLMFARYA